MKSRYLILIPLILLGLFLIPLVLLRNEISRKSDPAGGKTEAIPESTEAAETPETHPQPEIVPPAPTPPPTYTTAPPSPDGIGKIFMGREISHVMGHPGIGWLERDEREKEEAPSKAIAMLGLAPDTVIADIGAGSGYYSFRIAPLVPEGKVIAVDIQPEMLDFLKNESAKRKIGNVEPHLGTVESVQLPANSIDAALMVDAYHEFSHPAEMLRSLHKALKPGGKIYLLEYRAEDPDVPIKPLHKMTAAQAIKEYEALGFTFVENKPGLPWQHLLIFEKQDLTASDLHLVTTITGYLETLVIPRINFEGTYAPEAIDYLRIKSSEARLSANLDLEIAIETAGPSGREPDSDFKLGPEIQEPSKDDTLRIILGRSPAFDLMLLDSTLGNALKMVAEKTALDIHITNRGVLLCQAGFYPFEENKSLNRRILKTIYRHNIEKSSDQGGR